MSVVKFSKPPSRVKHTCNDGAKSGPLVAFLPQCGATPRGEPQAPHSKGFGAIVLSGYP